MLKLKHTLVLLAALIAVLPAYSRNINKKFTYFSSEGGALFYVYPQKMPKTADCVAKKPLTYDVTYLASGDSVSITAYLITKERYSFSQAKVMLSDKVLATDNIEIIFIDIKGKKYVNRLRFKVHRNVFNTMLDSLVPFTLDYGYGCTFRFADKKWKSVQQDLHDIFITIDSMKVGSTN